MKDKILFLTDLWFFNFGMAKFIQESYDAELYAIFDVDYKARKFFENQQIVEYKKKWFYLDCFKPNHTKPDLKYLSEFEKKYNINLWTVVFYDREFYQYNQFYKFSDDEILTIVENECRFFENILDEVKPNFVSMYFTISHFQELLRLMCLKRGIKILMFSGSKIGKTMMISQKGLVMDNNDSSKQNLSSIVSAEKIASFEEFVQKFTMYDTLNHYIKTQFEDNFWKRYKPLLQFLFSKHTPTYKIRYTYFGKTRSKVFLNKLSNFFKRKYRKFFVDRHMLKIIINNERFTYYPLHFEPERNLLIDSPLQSNQLEIIKNISKSLPVDVWLYVKEHPTQKVIGWRKISFYKEIEKLPNVRLIHPSVKPDQILQKCSLVLTIAGTAGLESLFYKKPVITFTQAFYSNVENVYRIKNLIELPSLIRKILENTNDITNDKYSLNEFMEKVSKNIFVFDVTKIAADFSYRFGLKGAIMDSDLSSLEINSFIEDYKNSFKLLANQHIKKINDFNNISKS